jgi:hypothetical protein
MANNARMKQPYVLCKVGGRGLVTILLIGIGNSSQTDPT